MFFSWRRIRQLNSSSTSRPRTRRSKRVRPTLEYLEERNLLDITPLMVTTIADSGPGSLRQAITTANTQAGPTTIDFAIGSGVQTIALDSVLPVITAPVVLDGTSQPGFNGTPLIVLTPSPNIDASGYFNGLDIQADGCTVKGLVINNWPYNILINSNNNVVEGNFLGTDATGTANGNTQLPPPVPMSPNGFDLFISGNSNTIGGTISADRNIISGDGSGITIGNEQQTAVENNLVEGNFIGTDVTGTVAVGQPEYGIDLGGLAGHNTIGGTAPGAGNVISGSVDHGLSLWDFGGGDVVQGNKIGTNAAGTAAVPNGNRNPVTVGDITDSEGVYVAGPNETIGGTAPGAGNVISGNYGPGIELQAFSYDNMDQNGSDEAANDLIEGNFIGTDASGSAALPNQGDGVYINEASTNTLTGNFISGNQGAGVVVSSGVSNVLTGNFIGTNTTGTTALANQGGGIVLENLAAKNILGGTASGAGNVISGNAPVGILIGSGPSGNIVEGNLIGTNASNALDLGNGLYGVAVLNATDNTIGGSVTGAGNVIGNSTEFGLLLSNGAGSNVVQGNDIGVGSSGVALPNGLDGIALVASPFNTIGGTVAGTGNVISGNGRFGVFLNATGTSANLLQGNLIGTNAAGTAALPNVFDGIAAFNGAANNTIGGTMAGAGNLLSGNDRFGIYFNGSGTTGNAVEGNTIGLNQAAAAALANTFDGIAILSGANGDTIGGTATGAGNTIAANGRFGILLGAASNVVEGNVIGTNTADASGLGNALDGIGIIGAANNIVGGTVTGAGNVISGNDRFGVFVDGSGATNNLFEQNLMGLAPNGTTALPNTFDGIAVFGGATDNTIGGTATNAGNVLSGNGRFGAYFNGSGTSGNVLEGNLIGVDSAGTVVANTFDGVALLEGASGNTVGGTDTGAGNTIAGNGRFGVLVGSTGTRGNVLEGNFIGTNATGGTGLGNTNTGVIIETGASGNTVGGTTSGAGNTIAFNGNSGVVIGEAVADNTTVGDAILGNAIFSNTGPHALGIDLANDGVTANGPAGSGRSGPNDLQNYPVFTPATATVSGGNATATLSFSSLANSTFRLEFFLNEATDTPAQGRTFLGAITVTTDANGNLATATSASEGVTVGTPSGGIVQVTLPLPSGTTTGSLTATATATTVSSGTAGTVGDTSEFSAPAILSAG